MSVRVTTVDSDIGEAHELKDSNESSRPAEEFQLTISEMGQFMKSQSRQVQLEPPQRLADVIRNSISFS